MVSFPGATLKEILHYLDVHLTNFSGYFMFGILNKNRPTSFSEDSGARLAGGRGGGVQGSGPLPFFDTVQIVPSNSSTNLEETLWKISLKNEESIKTMYQQHSLEVIQR